MSRLIKRGGSAAFFIDDRMQLTADTEVSRDYLAEMKMLATRGLRIDH